MVDYIKREDAEGTIRYFFSVDNLFIDKGAEVRRLTNKEKCDEALKYIEHLSSADVAPVVRCKDCIYYQDNNNGYPHDGCRWRTDETPDADDFCSMADAAKWLTNLREDCGRYQDLWHYAEALDQIIELLSADVAPVRHAMWIEYGENKDGTHNMRCSKCGAGLKSKGHANSYYTKRKYRYCRNCGAKMGEEEINE